MNIPRRTAFYDSPAMAALLLAAAAAAVAPLLARAAAMRRNAARPVAAAAAETAPLHLSKVALPAALAQAIKPSESVPRAPSVSLSSRFRLVGSMLGSSAGGTNEVWTAILEDSQLRRQLRAKPGDELLPGCTVAETGSSFVRVETPDGEETIVRAGSSPRATKGGAGASAAAQADGEGLDAFGGRLVGERHWEYSREALMGYYRELLDEPDRLVAVFDSLEPNYAGDGKIDGYRLNVLGEADFFKSVGFEQGDIVRTVNGVRMTNRRRAENFIRRVVEHGLDTIVIEFDRGDEQLKNVYQTF